MNAWERDNASQVSIYWPPGISVRYGIVRERVVYF